MCACRASGAARCGKACAPQAAGYLKTALPFFDSGRAGSRRLPALPVRTAGTQGESPDAPPQEWEGTKKPMDRPCKAGPGYSGLLFTRPAFMEIMELAEQGLVANLVVKDHSRLGRNRLVVGQLLEEDFVRLNVRYIAIYG